MLANVKGVFSEAEIGKIVFQIMKQLQFLHSKQIVYKFLTPQNIIIQKGFRPGEPIELRITDIAMM